MEAVLVSGPANKPKALNLDQQRATLIGELYEPLKKLGAHLIEESQPADKGQLKYHISVRLSSDEDPTRIPLFVSIPRESVKELHGTVKGLGLPWIAHVDLLKRY